MAYGCFGFAIDFAECFPKWRIEKQRIVTKTLLTPWSGNNASFAGFTYGYFSQTMRLWSAKREHTDESSRSFLFGNIPQLMNQLLIITNLVCRLLLEKKK